MLIKIQSKRKEYQDIEINQVTQITPVPEGFVIDGQFFPHSLFCFYIEDNEGKVVFDNQFIEAEYTIVSQGEE
jgi:hypothetical protein